MRNCDGIRIHSHLVHKRILNHLAKIAKWLSFVVSTYLYGTINCVFLLCDITVLRDSTSSSCWMSKTSLLDRCNIWSLSDCIRIGTHNYSIFKRTINHVAKLAKWYGCVVSIYLYGALDCVFLSCHISVLEEIYTQLLPEFQGTPCSKLAQYPKFKRLHWEWNPQLLSL